MFKRPRRPKQVRPAPSSLSLDTGNKRQGYDNIRNPVTARKFREQADRWIAYNEVAIYFLLRNEDVWTPWVSADAKAKIDAEIAKEQGMAAQQKD